MKYLYYIFRLFKCKHKYSIYGTAERLTHKGTTKSNIIVLKCSRCGGMINHEVE